MANLFEDIAPPEALAERFEIRGGSFTVRGLRNREWAQIWKRFPLLRRLADGEEVDKVELDLEAAEAHPAIIAAAVGRVGDRELEALILDRLSDDEMQAAFQAIMRLGSRPTTSPPPEAGELAAGQAGEAAAAEAAASSTTSPGQSSS